LFYQEQKIILSRRGDVLYKEGKDQKPFLAEAQRLWGRSRAKEFFSIARENF
jgi:hypothetical protein